MVLQEEFINDFTTTLTAGIDATQVSIAVAAAAPKDGTFRILIYSELMKVTAGGTTLTWTVERGAEGTTGSSHANAAQVSVILTKGAQDSMGNASAARVFANAAVTISNATETALPFDGEDFDTEDWHDNVTNNTRLTAKRPGICSISARAQWATNGTGAREIIIKKNGTDSISRLKDLNPDAGAETKQEISIASFRLLAGDFVELFVFQSSGGNLDIEAFFDDSPLLDIARIGDVP